MEKEKKQKSIDDVFAEAISGADLKPRGKWVVGKDFTSSKAAVAADPPSGLQEKKKETSIWGSIAAGVGVAVGVALVASELWNLAYSSDPDPDPEDKGNKMMRQPGNRPLYMPRQEFEENPKDYFRNLRRK